MPVKPKVLISRSPESSGLYEKAVEKAGGVPLSFHCPDPEMDFDALILAGGGDMDPIEFREPNQGSFDIDVPRDKAELALVSRCINENKPIIFIVKYDIFVNRFAKINIGVVTSVRRTVSKTVVIFIL